MRDSPDGSTDSDGRGCFRSPEVRSAISRLCGKLWRDSMDGANDGSSRISARRRPGQRPPSTPAPGASGRSPSLPRPMDSGEHVGHSALARSGSANRQRDRRRARAAPCRAKQQLANPTKSFLLCTTRSPATSLDSGSDHRSSARPKQECDLSETRGPGRGRPEKTEKPACAGLSVSSGGAIRTGDLRAMSRGS
jgi:hypothetical protein